jgi:RNA polymerase sigma-70 factor, ECF subfamily
MGRFSKVFLAHASPIGFDVLPDLEARLGEILHAAQAAWPEVDLPPEVFVRHLAERMPARGTPDAALAACAASDLYLACACVHGNTIAIAALDRAFIANVGAYVAHLDPSQPFAEDIKQHLRSKLLVASDDAAPKIADYAGRGSLAGWLRVAAVWAARDLQRRQRRTVTLDENAGGATARGEGADPEMDYLKRRYSVEFKQAFGEVLAALPPREQNILNLYFVDGTTLAAIGKIYKVHESTVARWVARCRETILQETRRKLSERLKLETGEFESLMGLVQSRLDLSISRYFKLRENK